MSKVIKFTQEMIEQLRNEFEAAIASAKMVNGEFNFRRVLGSTNAKATLRFTETAYLKMIGLVNAFDKEVAWHCTCERAENENEYLITDVLVYPQTVTGVTVEMDTEEYAKWIENGILNNDQRFFELHAQGHSHVNMGTTPSGTDLQHQRAILEDVRNNGFYIFMIWNKRNEHTCWIYDLGKNIVFENKDITVIIGDDEHDYDKFIKDAKNIVKTKTTQYQGASVVGGYTVASATQTKYTTPSAQETTPASTKATPNAKQKPKVKAVASVPNHPYQTSMYDDDISDPFFAKGDYYNWR